MSRSEKAAPEVAPDDEADEAPIADGFVRCTNPDLGDAIADLPEQALGIHRARGWIPVDEPTDAPAPADDDDTAQAEEADADTKES